jgi:hypothetical protein
MKSSLQKNYQQYCVATQVVLTNHTGADMTWQQNDDVPID